MSYYYYFASSIKQICRFVEVGNVNQDENIRRNFEIRKKQRESSIKIFLCQTIIPGNKRSIDYNSCNTNDNHHFDRYIRPNYFHHSSISTNHDMDIATLLDSIVRSSPSSMYVQ